MDHRDVDDVASSSGQGCEVEDGIDDDFIIFSPASGDEAVPLLCCRDDVDLAEAMHIFFHLQWLWTETVHSIVCMQDSIF